MLLTYNYIVCDLLNFYGCNSPSIPTEVEAFLNTFGPDGYYLPTDRCDFDTINLTYIAQSFDISQLSTVPTDMLAVFPCES